MIEKEYHLGLKHAYEVFLLAEEVVDKGTFPIMSSFMNEELFLWEQVIKNSQTPQGTFLELGCGGGRAIIRLQNFGINVTGIDYNPYLIQHCLKRGLNVRSGNIFDPLPNDLYEKADFVGIGFDTLFNFSCEERVQWINYAYQALRPGGLLMLSYYSDNKYVDKHTTERIAWYDITNKPPTGYKHVAYTQNGERGLRLVAPDGSIPWQSAWKRKEDVIAEAKTWPGFIIEDIILFPCQIGSLLVLQKV